MPYTSEFESSTMKASVSFVVVATGAAISIQYVSPVVGMSILLLRLQLVPFQTW